MKWRLKKQLIIFFLISGGSIIHAIDIQDATNPTIVYYREVDHVDITDVEFCGGYLFVSMHNLRLHERGRVVVFHSLSSSQPMAIKYNITGNVKQRASQGHGWLNELGRWITYQLVQVCHQYGVGSRPAL